MSTGFRGVRPRISIVTPSFNQGRFLEETIRSVLSQAYESLEYIVVDGGSADGSAEIIQGFEPSLAFWCSERDKGQADALNKGFSRATGDVLGFLNSDDVYCPGALGRVAEAWRASERKEEFWVAFPVEDRNKAGTVVSWLNRTPPVLARWLDLASFSSLHQPGVFWSRNLYSRVGGFDPSYHYAFDRKFFVSLLKAGYEYVSQPGPAVASFRLHEEAKSGQLSTMPWSETAFFAEFVRLSEELGVGVSKEFIRRVRREELQVLMSDAVVGADARIVVVARLLRLGLRRPGVFRSRFFLGAVRRLAMRAGL